MPVSITLNTNITSRHASIHERYTSAQAFPRCRRSSRPLCPSAGAASRERCVFFAGLPGTGKSLLGHQLTHLAHALGRTVHTPAVGCGRPVFEASAAGQRYPVVQGVTHGVIRKAAGLWARRAVVQWHQRYPEAGHMLIGETPLVGHRFIELARQRADAAEPLLQMACFVVPVPSRAVRACPS